MVLGSLSLYQKWVTGIFSRGVAASQGWQPYHFHKLIVYKSGSLNLLEIFGHVIGLYRDCFPFCLSFMSRLIKIHFKKKRVKCTLVQTPRLCAARTAHRGSRGIALLFLDHGTRKGWGVSVTRRPLYPRERPATHCTGGWAGLDRCGKSRPHRDSIPGPSRP